MGIQENAVFVQEGILTVRGCLLGHPLLNTNTMLISYNTDLATMSLIWICFKMPAVSLHITAVSFCFGLIFQTVLPICPFSPTPQIAYCSHIWLRFVFNFTKFSLLYAVSFKTTCWQYPNCIRCVYKRLLVSFFKPVAAKFVFRFIFLYGFTVESLLLKALKSPVNRNWNSVSIFSLFDQ